MSDTPLRDRRGKPMKTYSATDAKNAFGSVLEDAGAYGAVAITKHDKPRFVLLSIDEYEAGMGDSPDVLKQLDARYAAMVERMQTPEAKAAGHALFGRKRG